MGKALYLKSDEEIEQIRKSSLLVGNTLAEVAKAVGPGVTTGSLDKLAEEYILRQGAKPAFKGYHGFPFTLCISPNDQVVHGFPGDYTLKEGDILSVDCGVNLNGFFGDSAYTFMIGEVDPAVRDLLRRTKEALYKGIDNAVEGKRIGDISAAIQDHVEQFGYGVVRELVGHGVGKALHEAPEVPNYGKRGSGPKLTKGMVIAIEPMINLGTRNVKTWKDGWTISTADKKPSAHYEHTVAVGKQKADILSSFQEIEAVLNARSMETV
ncbi:MAG: type I methionyl aminopeptidase [Bacteroidia bacterium]|nr:type I methionyl aminopeptidase [Bacteroidia bacterium]